MAKYEEFLKKVKTDEKLREKVEAVKAEYLHEVIALAKEEGFELKPDDMGKGELSDEALETVAAAGGGSRGSCGTGYTPLY
jgi:predicted ribosomally synthesized peptide with nif11-like leader